MVRVLFLFLIVFTIVACGGKESVASKKAPIEAGEQAAGPCPMANGPDETGMPSESRIFGWIEDLVGIGFRRTGTPAGYAAAAYVKCQFESLGLKDVHYEYASSWKWESTNSSVEIAGEEVDAFPSTFSFVTPDVPSVFSTGPKGLVTELVDVGLGTPIEQQLRDVAGKVVLFDLKFILPTAGLAPFMEFLWDPNLTVVEPSVIIANPYLTTYSDVLNAAMDAGAVGFIGVLADYFDSNKYYNEFYRRISVTIPGFWVSPKEGARVRGLLAEGNNQVTMMMEGSREVVEARSVVGILPGKSTDTIMVQSHHDSVFYGAVEDGSGTASVLAQAQYFASQPAETREKTLMFSTFDTHFTGYQGHMAFVEKYIINKETPYNTLDKVDRDQLVPVAEAFIDIIDAIDATPSDQIGLPLLALGSELSL